MIKYAANAMLATRISFMNDIANLCERVGADVNLVRKGIGTDPRIGGKFLYPGLGYGGSCFPKDVKALIHTAAEHDYRLEILEAVENVNRRQKEVLAGKIERVFGPNLRGRTFAVWGLSFKPETDDVRESASMVIIRQLAAAGAHVRVYDPAAMDTAKRALADVSTDSVTYCESMYSAVEGVDALVLATEWKEFRLPDWDAVAKAMKTPPKGSMRTIFDGRNIYDKAELAEKGFAYFGIGQ
jgi:UDPglucose 6-dehydrogenase